MREPGIVSGGPVGNVHCRECGTSEEWFDGYEKDSILDEHEHCDVTVSLYDVGR